MKDQARRPDQLDRCRACASDNLMLFLPMGDHPPANMFVRPEDRDAPQPAFPLNTQACLDCGMIQVADQIPDGFFTHYLYVPSGARTMHGHFEGLAGVLTDIAHGGLIVDVGCNDGLMLSFANRMGARTLGIDPAAIASAGGRSNSTRLIAICAVTFTIFSPPGMPVANRGRSPRRATTGLMLWCMRLPGAGALGWPGV